MSKRDIHENKWRRGGGKYYRAKAHYSITAKIGNKKNENDKKIRGINKVRNELMQKIDSVTRSYAGKCAGRMLSDVVNEIYGIFAEECEKLREAGYVESVSEEIIKNRIKDVLIREYNKLNASGGKPITNGVHDER